jgi:cytochrome d ubiquinol oxidase subunit I
LLIRHPTSPLFRRAFGLSLAVACVTAFAQPLSGHESAQGIAELQPWKLAAAEACFHTERGAPILVGGLPDEETGEVKGAIRVPYALSILATNHADSEVKGLDAFPREDWPPVARTHFAFDVMVGAGSAMAALAALAALLAFRRRGLPDQRWFLRAVVACGPLGLVALEAGWCVTELGRQPWVVHGALRTRDAVTPFPHLAAPFFAFTLLYLFLGAAVVFLLYNQLRKAPAEGSPSEEPHGH